MLKSVSLDLDNALYISDTSAGINGLCSYTASALGRTHGFWEKEYQRIRHHVRETEWQHTQCYDIAYRIYLLFNELGIDTTRANEFAEAYYRAEMDGSQFFPEVPSLIMKLRDKYKVGVTTDSPLVARGDMRYLERAGIDVSDLDFVIASSGASKRTGEPYKRLAEEMRKYGITPPEIVHVGDSVESDIIPAKEKGMRAILFSPLETSFEELFSKIERLDYPNGSSVYL